MIVRDSTTPRGRHVPMPATNPDLAPIRKHLDDQRIALTWREVNARHWEYRQRRLQETAS